MSPSPRALVFGAAGMLGSQFVRSFAPLAESAGWGVRAFVRPSQRDAGRFADFVNVEEFAGDYTDASDVENALGGVSRVFMCTKNGPEQYAAEVQIIDVARELGVELIMKIAAARSLCYEGSPSMFFDTHARITRHLEESGVPHCHLRPGWEMQNMLMLAVPTLDTGVVSWPWPGDFKLNHVDGREASEVAATFFLRDVEALGGRDFHVLGEHEYTPTEVVEVLSAVTGKPVRYLPCTHQEFVANLEKAGLPTVIARAVDGVFSELYRTGQKVDDRVYTRRDIGETPRSLKTFFDEYGISDARARLEKGFESG